MASSLEDSILFSTLIHIQVQILIKITYESVVGFQNIR